MKNVLARIWSKLQLILQIRKKILLAVAIIIVGSGTAAFGMAMQRRVETQRNSQTDKSNSKPSSEQPSLASETVGMNNDSQLDTETSWPGEVVSLSDVEVQPQREGTVSEWYVHIGQRIRAGQMLGRLSAPPATPELTKMLAEQSESLARSRVQAKARVDYTARIQHELITLRDTLDRTSGSTGSILIEASSQDVGSALATARVTSERAEELAMAKERALRTKIDEILRRHVLKLTNAKDPQSIRYGNLNDGYGWRDQNARNQYEALVLKLATELRDPSALPLEAARQYLRIALLVVNSSVQTDVLMQSDLNEVRDMVAKDQEEFFDFVSDYEEAKTDASMKVSEYKAKEVEFQLASLANQKEYAEQKKEINEKLAELDQELAMANGEVAAAEAAYRTVSAAITGGLTINAPRSGVISAIMKQPGDFIEPGMPVAMLNAASKDERFVRFRVPSNVEVPSVGAELHTIRPGFPKDARRVQVVGIGTSLDANGAYVADAKFIDESDWPVHASVRVLSDGIHESIFIPLSAVWWDSAGKANVWLIDEMSRLLQRPIETGRAVNDRIEVRKGLEFGDRYVAKATDKLSSGMTVSAASAAQAANGNSGEQAGQDGPMQMSGHEE